MKVKNYKYLTDEEIIEKLKDSSIEEIFIFLTKDIFCSILEKLRPAIEVKNLEFEWENNWFKSYTVPLQHYINWIVNNIYVSYYRKIFDSNLEEQLKILVDIHKLIIYSNFSLEKQYDFLNFCMKLFNTWQYNEKEWCIKIYEKLAEILDNKQVEKIIHNTRSKLLK